MAKISKDCAKQLALHLTEKNKLEWWAERKKMGVLAGAIYKKHVPKAVMDLFEKHKPWIESTTTLQLYVHGFNGEYINFEPGLPKRNTGPYVSPSEQDCLKLRKAYDKCKDMGNAYDKLRKDIENAALLLGTTSKVAEAFPESVDFLNKYFDVKHLPAVINIDSIKKRLK